MESKCVGMRQDWQDQGIEIHRSLWSLKEFHCIHFDRCTCFYPGDCAKNSRRCYDCRSNPSSRAHVMWMFSRNMQKSCNKKSGNLRPHQRQLRPGFQSEQGLLLAVLPDLVCATSEDVSGPDECIFYFPPYSSYCAHVARVDACWCILHQMLRLRPKPFQKLGMTTKKSFRDKENRPDMAWQLERLEVVAAVAWVTLW